MFRRFHCSSRPSPRSYVPHVPSFRLCGPRALPASPHEIPTGAAPPRSFPNPFVPRQRDLIPRDMSSMPETFVEPVPSFKVGPMAIPLIPGRQRLAWTLVLAGWTLVGLGYFASLRYGMAPAPTGTEIQLLVYAVGTSWIWAALTPPVLQVTGNASFTGRHGLDRAVASTFWRRPASFWCPALSSGRSAGQPG